MLFVPTQWPFQKLFRILVGLWLLFAGKLRLEMVSFLLAPRQTQHFVVPHRLLPVLLERRLELRLLLGPVRWLDPVPVGLPAGRLELPVEPL